ncbi:hypothetical protein CHH28_12955 [Bacterioplanes sanyensis]|uniref:UmuC domain-containing protein n=1 Tax=Bacterioplanes sanyensis TaxID=1249553 RepID=A0A222FKF8_9GAMM|nr:DNA polymerase Y family protein [Bacterioplanes sanyensis]ASP39527.1 hypothetical protein CHH28_12955 [Bacterioplanes sanyensis]
MRWLYVHFPQLYLHACGADLQQPQALLDALGQHVIDCNHIAQQQGVLPSMPSASAWCLCPDLQAQRLDETRQHHWLQQRAQWAYQFSAQVSLDAPEGLWLEVASMARLFGSLQQLWHSMSSEAQALGWPMQLGLANTAALAKLAAYNRWQQQPEPTIDAMDSLWQQCLDANPSQLQLTESQQLQLQRLGIGNLRQLLRLPEADIAQRLSPQLLTYIWQLQGKKQPTLTFFKPALTFNDDTVFIEEIEHRNGLLFPLTRMLASLSGFLWQRQLATQQLHIQLQHRHHNTTHWRINFAHPEYRQTELTFLCRHQLEKRRLPAPVTHMTLSVKHFVAQAGAQSNMAFSNAVSAADEHTLLNRLQARLEPEQLRRVAMTGDARPEHASQLPRHIDYHPHTGAQRSYGRPLWLLPTPHPCPTPERFDSGPERISAGWWDRNAVRRDYYRAWLGSSYVWVFRDDQQQWYLHGYFA